LIEKEIVGEEEKRAREQEKVKAGAVSAAGCLTATPFRCAKKKSTDFKKKANQNTKKTKPKRKKKTATCKRAGTSAGNP